MKYLANDHAESTDAPSSKDFEARPELFVLVPFKRRTNEKAIITALLLVILIMGCMMFR